MNTKTPVGEVRPSQLLWSYGPGALIDLPNLSVITMGTDQWEKERCQPIAEARLLTAVKKVLGAQVASLRMPPFNTNDFLDVFSPEAKIGVPVRAFPRWLRCVKCGLLSEFDIGLFECKENLYRPEQTRFVHKDCRGSKGDQPAKDADAVPARFLLACRNGHLDDFPWHYFVHSGPDDCRGTLRFFESGASLQTENLWVKCDECGVARSMAHAFGEIGKENLPACRGRHPHLDRFEEDGCQEEPRAVLLGATNCWFPITLSALAIPQINNPISKLIQDGWDIFEDLETIDELKVAVRTVSKTGALPGIEKHSIEDIWIALQAHRSDEDEDSIIKEDIKSPEWAVLTSENPPRDYPHFMSKKVNIPDGFEATLSQVLLLERLREVNALLGFTRIEAVEEASASEERPVVASLSRAALDWVPAGEVHGEGIFIQLNEASIQEWESLPAVKKLDKRMLLGHTGWRRQRSLEPNLGYDGIRYTMIHSLSHILIRELALECGYNAASIRERIYATSGDNPQAGILIYTAAADSDGTLGGLVELGKPENLGRLLRQALNRTKICSSDPLCAEHDPGKDRSLHGAACHACNFVAETSCERGNRYLDRSLIVPTLEHAAAAFFKSF
jgi:hypothetical protein